MFRTFRWHLECLIVVLLCLATLQSQLPSFHPASEQSAKRPQDGQWKNLFLALASSIPSGSHIMPSFSPVHSPSRESKSHLGDDMPAPGPAPSSLPALVASTSATRGKELPFNDPYTPLSSLPLPGLPGVSPQSATSGASPDAMGKPIGIAQPPLISSSSGTSYLSPSPASLWFTPPSPPARASLSSSSSGLSSSAPPPLLPPPLDTSNVSVGFPDAPLLPPSPGCCSTKMVPRPGLPSSSCQDLASELGVDSIQIEITSFQFNSSNLSLAIIIGPLTSVSFSVQEAISFRDRLDQNEVHFNSSLFGNYTLIQFQFYEPPAPSPIQVSIAGLPPLPLSSLNATTGEKAEHKPTLWLIVVIAAAAAVITLALLILFLWKCHRQCRIGKSRCKGEAVSSHCEVRSFGVASIPRSITTRLFTFDELRQATNNFNPENVLGEGGFGRVYKGVLKDGTEVAIKRFGNSGQGDREFVVEVEMLSRLHHRNLVKLIGYYASRDSSQHLLCYELISNGSLEAWLHGPQGSTQPLNWDTRLKIALDAARGLAYLHEDSQPCVIHRDFKASNILLETDFHAKVADFGLAKLAPEGAINYVATQVMGTFGYVAPEYAMTGHLLVKSDVYSYGVVLLELLSGRKPVDMSQPQGQENLVTWARPMLRDRERLGELADSRLECKYPKEDFVQVAAIAAACVAPEASQRPTMGEVVQSLRMLQTQSEYTTSGERRFSTDILPPLVPSRSFVASIQNAHQQTSAPLESDGSSSVFSSGPFSGFAFDNEVFSRSAVFSEDLHEGR
ncbi:hypothetical protein GOP47_0006150 [Adiantum capillus-veneris]|uniref:Protein kinase domain-containing protein n=1 Tax=Adiantum capillus-veneris TaxID=13818 RepID=A0A9D4V2C9_ADICA|nr:hypothetical protein GOP47_0006150 [Adiantum capillus-veneris]